jgi:enoyl-[acyl-carrier protein] reductase I
LMFAFQQEHSPLQRGITLDELGGAGLYLLSDLSTGVTGEIHFVDSGYNVIAMPHPDALKTADDKESPAYARAIKDAAR